jgi:hypothetical protein
MSILVISKSPLIAAQFKGLRPLWSFKSTSIGSGKCPNYEASISILVSS